MAHYLTLENETDRLSQNVDMKLPLYCAKSQKNTDLVCLGASLKSCLVLTYVSVPDAI